MGKDLKERAEQAYREKSDMTMTESGIPLKSYYTQEDLQNSGEKHSSAPGQFPFTRGIYEDMYRGRLWSRRELCGFASPEETNKRIKFLIDSGESAINFIADLPTHNGINSDHPRA
jgi:methylmalonyl-CoA mutase N-terminal domain/subunit